MNNKGFAISAILYSILVLFLVLLALFLFGMQNKKRILDTLKNDTLKSIEGVLSENDQLTFTLMKDNEIIYKDSITRDYFNYNIEQNDITNISCNNKAVPSYSNSVLTVNNITKNTTCILSSSINYTFDNLGTSETNILMVNDEKITKTLDIASDKKVIFNLNGKNVEIYNPNDLNNELTTETSDYRTINVHGNLIINDESNIGKIESPKTSDDIFIYATGSLVINGGNYDGRRCINSVSGKVVINNGMFTSSLGENVLNNGSNSIVINNGSFNHEAGVAIHNYRTGTIIINGGLFNSGSGATIYNSNSGIINIYNGTFVGGTNSAILNASSGTININQTNKPIYVSSKAINTSKAIPAIRNASTGTINIKSNTANNCTNYASDTTSGLCVYAEGDKNYSDVSANLALQNAASGNVNINGGTFYGGHQAINNNSSGVINITNAQILSGNRGINNYNKGTVNICNSTINATTVDLRNTLEGVINYNSNMIFTNGTNTPTVYNPNGTINANYSGTCEA